MIILERFGRETEGRCRDGSLIFLSALSNAKAVIELGYALRHCINLPSFSRLAVRFHSAQELP